MKKHIFLSFKRFAFTLLLGCAIMMQCLAQQTGVSASNSQPVAQPTVASESATQESPTAISASYVITPGDVIELKVYQEDELNAKSRVDLDGSVTLPLLGSVKVAGKTIADAAVQVKGLLQADYLVNPQVNLSVSDFAKRRFSVLGQVSKPGSFEIPANESVNLLQAIATAGGYTRIADSSKITVKRVINGKETIIRLNAKAMASEKNSKVFEIQADDTITVSESIW